MEARLTFFERSLHWLCIVSRIIFIKSTKQDLGGQCTNFVGTHVPLLESYLFLDILKHLLQIWCGSLQWDRSRFYHQISGIRLTPEDIGVQVRKALSRV